MDDKEIQEACAKLEKIKVLKKRLRNYLSRQTLKTLVKFSIIDLGDRLEIAVALNSEDEIQFYKSICPYEFQVENRIEGYDCFVVASVDSENSWTFTTKSRPDERVYAILVGAKKLTRQN